METNMTTPDIEAVKANLTRIMRGMITNDDLIQEEARFALAIITTLQARVDEAERERDQAVQRLNDMRLWAGKVQMEAQDLHERSKDQLATLRAAIAEAWARKERANYACSPEACVSWVMSPLSEFRNLDQPEPEGKAGSRLCGDLCDNPTCEVAKCAGYLVWPHDRTQPEPEDALVAALARSTGYSGATSPIAATIEFRTMTDRDAFFKAYFSAMRASRGLVRGEGVER